MTCTPLDDNSPVHKQIMGKSDEVGGASLIGKSKGYEMRRRSKDRDEN